MKSFKLDLKPYQFLERLHHVSLDAKGLYAPYGSPKAVIYIAIHRYINGNEYVMYCHYAPSMFDSDGYKVLIYDWALCRVYPNFASLSSFNYH